jgi:hypothetical protein
MDEDVHMVVVVGPVERKLGPRMSDRHPVKVAYRPACGG